MQIFFTTLIDFNGSVGVEEDPDHPALPGTPHRVIPFFLH